MARSAEERVLARLREAGKVLDQLRQYSYTGSMKATVDVPDHLYRRVKARAALEGRSVRDVTLELYEDWLAQPGPAQGEAGGSGEAADWLARWDDLGERIAKKAVDPRTTREILLADRR